MSQPERPTLHLAAAVADGAEIDWKRLESSESDPEGVRSLELIDSVLRDYGRAAEEVRARLQAPLLATGSRWGPLQILELIGAGSFGQVFRAFDRSLQRDVALKVLRDPPRSGAGVPEFLEEARRLARVRHPGVLTVYGVAVRHRRAGIWTELVRGRTLEAILLAEGAFAPEEAARIGIALCGALSAIHGAGLIHGDVKTENVMREEDGRVVLTDFGAMDDRFDESSEEHTCGSLLSLAPEVLRGARPSPASDVYALGVLLHRLLTAGYPFQAATPAELLAAIGRGAPPVAESTPPPLAAAVERALDPAPSRRFPGPNAMAQALRAALDPALPVKTAARESYRPARRDSLAAAFAACVAISAVVATAVTLFGIPWLAHHYRGSDPSASGAPASPATSVAALPSAPAESPAGGPVTPSASSPPAGLRADPVLYRASEVGSEPLADGAPIQAGDALFLAVETGPEPVVCYVLDEDAAGNDYVLFPLPGYRIANPIAPGARQILPESAPGGGPGRTWTVDSENGRENVVLITSIAPLPWLERLLRDVPRAAGDDAPAPATRPGGLVTRGIGHTAPPPPMGKLGAVLDRLRASEEFRDGRAGLWRIRLQARPNR